MKSLHDKLRDAILAFLATSPSEPQKPKPGFAVLSRPEELELLQTFQEATQHVDRLSEGTVAEIGMEIDVGQAYLLLSFAFLCALQAARTGSLQMLRAGALGLVLDRDQLDYRDVLVELSVIEDCAIRLGSDLKSSLEHVLRFASEKRRDTILDYLNRTPSFRGLGVMGMAASGSGPTLEYSQQPI